MNLKKKLDQWREAGLIDTATAQSINDYEKNISKPLMLYAISGIGTLSLCLGLISIIAANWQNISPNIKLGIDLLLGLGLCGYLAISYEQLSKWVKEILIVLISGWTLASIALIGQIYQLGGDGKSAITLWTLLIIPLLLQGRSTASGVILLGSLSATYGLWIDYLNSAHMVTLIPGIALGVLGLSLYKPIYQKRPELLSVFAFVALASILFGASFTSIMFYHNMTPKKEIKYIYEALILSIPSAYFVWYLIKHQAKSIQIALFASIFCFFAPLLIPHKGHLDLVAILFFLGYWSIVAKAALDMGQVILFRLATFAVATRLVIVYFELVGTLLDTGLLFLTGGALILFITRFWYKKQHELLSERQDHLSQEITSETASQSSKTSSSTHPEHDITDQNEVQSKESSTNSDQSKTQEATTHLSKQGDHNQ